MENICSLSSKVKSYVCAVKIIMNVNIHLEQICSV